MRLCARRLVTCLSLLVLCLASRVSAADPPQPKKVRPARLKISGYGLLGNRELKRVLTTLELAGKKPEFFGADFIEDATLVLAARVKSDGYLKPAITVELQLADGGQLQVKAQDLLENPLPRPLRVRQARFRIRKGLLYYFAALEFRGLHSVPLKEARSYFVE